MAAPLQGGGHRHLCCFCFFAGPERPDPFHQVVAQPDAEGVRFCCREHAASLVLLEALFGRMCRLPDVQRSKGTRFPQTLSVELDDVD